MTSKPDPLNTLTLVVDVSVPCPDWPDGLQARLEDIARLTLDRAQTGDKIAGAEVSMSLVLADNAFVRKLNRDFRGKDKPTNVLSFPLQDEDYFEEINLGDVVLAYETVRDEAAQQGKKFEDHTLHLVVHGILHLVGFDHESEADAEKMEALEIAILRDLGIENPYEA